MVGQVFSAKGPEVNDWNRLPNGMVTAESVNSKFDNNNDNDDDDDDDDDDDNSNNNNSSSKNNSNDKNHNDKR